MTLILPTPRTFFGSFRNVLPFPVRLADDLAIARRSQDVLRGPYVCYNVMTYRYYNEMTRIVCANGVTSSRCIRWCVDYGSAERSDYAKRIANV